MIVPKKKDTLRELALSLFLMLEFNPDTSSFSLIARIRERAVTALRSAATYTGVIGHRDVENFLNSRHLKFTIPYKGDIVKGDILRFTEDAYDSRRKPPRWLGKRNVTAEVTGMRHNNGDPMLVMKVIASMGAWILKPDTEIHRPLKLIARSDAQRALWEDEAERKKIKNQKPASPKTIREAAKETFLSKKKAD